MKISDSINDTPRQGYQHIPARYVLILISTSIIDNKEYPMEKGAEKNRIHLRPSYEGPLKLYSIAISPGAKSDV